MNSQQTVGDFFSRGFPDYNWGITDFHLTCDELIGAYKGKSQTDSYKRIGYFAQRWYANQFMQDFGLAIPGYRAQILNCGMVAITTTLIALLNDRKVLPGAQVVLAKEVYPRVPNVYQRLGFKVVRVDSSDLRAISLAKGHAPKIIHLETIGNGFDLPVLDVEGLLSVCWRTEVTIIIDNTLATLELVNPFQTLNRLKQELGEPNLDG